MKKAIWAGFIVLAVLLLVSVILPRTQKAAVQENQEKVTVQEKVAQPSATPTVGTVAWWDDDAVWSNDSGGRDKWLDSEYEFMHSVVGPVAETTERWLGSVAPDLVYVEASKCKGNLRLSESEACEIHLSKNMEKIFRKCGDSRPSDVRSCVVGMDPEVGSEEKVEWSKISQR
jgi:hypothetical protein